MYIYTIYSIYILYIECIYRETFYIIARYICMDELRRARKLLSATQSLTSVAVE